jgi:hypothetical protein
MDVYLHIGWHKTGTTAIQKMLLRNRSLLRERLDMGYPAAGLYKASHHFPAWALQQPLRARLLKELGCTASPEAMFREMLEESSRQGLKSIVISSEEFAPIHRYDIDRIAKSFAGHRVIVVAYVRRQDDYVESVYNQMVKFWRSRYTRDFGTFLEGHLKSDRLEYDRYFRQWANAFGRDNLQVRIYDRRRFRSQDARLDFCDAIGLDEKGLVLEEGAVNESLDFDSVCFLARFNTVPLSEAQHQEVVKALRERAAANPCASSTFLDAAQRQRVAARFAESNRKFAEDFLGGRDAFDPVDAADARGPALFDEQRFMEILSFVLPRLLGGPRAQTPLKRATPRRITA